MHFLAAVRLNYVYFIMEQLQPPWLTGKQIKQSLDANSDNYRGLQRL